MKRNSLTFIIGLLLALVFGAMLFCYQVRQTEIALVTRFGKPQRSETEPGFKWKLPWPIEKIQKFDKRIQDLEGKGDKFEEALTQDKQPVLIGVYAGWTISNPALFRERFGGNEFAVSRAQADLESLIRSKKNEIVGKHPFAHFISPDEDSVKFADIEAEILAGVQPVTRTSYGVEVRFLGIKRIGLPESSTEKVFGRMKAERNRFVQKLQADGDAQAANITSAANLQRDKLLADARATADRIKGEAEKEANESLKVLEQKPDLAIFLIKIKALEDALRDRSTLILDQRTPPFDLLDAGSKSNPKPLVSPGNK